MTGFQFSASGSATAIRALANNQYVTAADATTPLIANSTTSSGPAQQFDVVDLGNGNIALRAHSDNLYATAGNAGASALVASSTAVGPSETFQEVTVSGGVALKAQANGMYVCADNSGASALIANRTAAGPWETFVFETPGVAGNGGLGDANIKYFGRWDFSNASQYISYWGGAYIKVNFSGTTVKIKLGNTSNYYAKIDNGPWITYANASGTLNLTPTPLANGTHSLSVAQGKDYAYTFNFQGLILDAGATTSPPTVGPALVEYIGDSITSGYTDAQADVSDYAWVCSESLKCEHTQIAYPGIALVTGTGVNSDKTGMDTQYFKLQPLGFASPPNWDFSKYTPKVVVINLGQNDGKDTVSAFENDYTSLLAGIETKFPNADIFVMRPFSGIWAAETLTVVNTRISAGDSKVHYVNTTGWLSSGDYNDGVHPSVSGHIKAANLLQPILAPYIGSGSPSQVAVPSFSPGGGTYTSAPNVTIATATSGASIRYTTDGSTPSETAGTIYSGPVNISSTTTLHAIAYESGFTASTVVNATYTISIPSSTVAIRALANNQYVTAADATTSLIANSSTSIGSAQQFDVVDLGGGNIALRAHSDNLYVTAESAGVDPLIANRTTAGLWETFQKVTVSGGVALKAQANGMYVSAENTGASPLIADRTAAGVWETFVFETPGASAYAAPPSFSPAAGSYTSATSVTITTATSGASIHYTTDGSTPSKTNGTLYSGPVTIGSTATLQAIAYENGFGDSIVSSATYTIGPPPVTTGHYLGVTCGYSYTDQLTGPSPATNPNQSLYNLEGFSRTDPNNPTWRVWVSELRQAGVDFVCPNCIGSQPHSDYPPSIIAPMVKAVNDQGLTDQLKFALFDDNASSWVAQWNMANGRGYGYGLPFDIADPNNWKYIYDYNYKIFFQTVPDANRFKIDGRPVIIIWTGNTYFIANMQGNASKAMTYVRQGCQRDFGFNPYIILSGDFFRNDTTCNNPGIADAAQNWFSWPGPWYSLTANFGVNIGVAIAGGWYPGHANYVDPNHGQLFDTNLTNTVDAGALLTLCEGFTDVEENCAQWRVRNMDANGNALGYSQTLYDYPNQRINILRKHSRNPFPGDLLLEAEGCDNYGGANGGNGKVNFYRNGNIAIETTDDSPGGGYDVGWIQNGEWLEWNEVPLNGTPHFMVRVATTTATARIHWVIDGVAKPSVTLPNTGGRQTWTTFDTGPQGTFTKSYHTVRIVFENGGESINWWQLSLAGTSPQVVAPIFSPAGGSYTSAQNVTITTTTSGATIRYTTDNSTPSETVGTLYSGPVSVSSSVTLNAIAYESGFADSTVASAAYTFAPTSFSTVAIRALVNNQYVTAADATTSLIANSSTKSGAAQQFDVVDLGGGNIALRAHSDSLYVTAENAGTSPLIANQTAVGPWETFQEIQVSGGMALKLAANGMYVSADNAGANPLIANRTVAGPWETFVFETPGSSAFAAPPSFSPAGGSYTSAQSVTITTTTSGASIRYTTDGSTPSETVGTLYSGPVNVSSTTKLQAIAYKSGDTDSTVSSASYTINIPPPPQVAAPTFSPAGGTYSSAQSVTITTTTSGASIRFTTDGSTPTSTTGTIYSGPANVSATATLKAIAYASGDTDSTVSSATYTIISLPPSPVISSASTASGTAGSAFSYQITASHSPTSYAATGLPTGLSVDASTGLISGTPTAAGTSSVTLDATNAGGTGTQTLTLTVTQKSTNVWNLVGAADFNGDGSPDLIWQNTSTGERTIWLMNGTTAVSSVSLGTVSTDWNIVGAADFLKNGNSDLILQNTVTGERTIWLMNGTTHASTVSIATIPTEWDLVGAADFNGDGNSDLIWQDTVTGERAFWLMNGTTPVSSLRIATIPTNWDIVGAADFSGTGKPDLIWQDTTTGQRALWLMNGTTPVSSVSLGMVATNWNLVGAADFNKNGNSDLLWQDTASNQWAIWLMNGTTYVSSVSFTFGLPQAPKPSFNPAGGSYTGAQSVTISDATSGVSIRYTTDGSTPSETVGTIYSGPVNISSTTTLQAIAYGSGSTDSPIVSGTYTIGSTPTTVAIRALANNQYVTAADATTSLIANSSTSIGSAQQFDVVDLGGGNIALRAHSDNLYVTAENAGASPLIANRTAVGPWETFQKVTVSGGVTLKAQANGMYVSAENTGASPLIADRTAASVWETFVFETPGASAYAAPPSFSPAGGSYTSAPSVTIATATSGASIRYTTDGSTPSKTNGTLYSGPVTIGSTATLQAIAYENGFGDSIVSSATYTIGPPPITTGHYLGVTCGYSYTDQLTGPSPATNPNQSLYNLEGFSRTDPNNPTWRVWVSELRQAGVDFVCPNCIGSQPRSDCPPSIIAPMVKAVNDQGLTDQLKFALFDDNASSWVAQWNMANGRGYGYGLPFDIADPNNWKYIYDYNYKIFFQTVPDANRFKINGRPVIIIWTGNTYFIANMQGNASKAMTYVRQGCQRDFGFNPYIILSDDFFRNDTTCNNPGIADAGQGWFIWNGPWYSLRSINGANVGVAIAGGWYPGHANYVDPNHGQLFDTNLTNTVDAGALLTLCEGFTDVEENCAQWRVRNMDANGNALGYSQTLYDYPNQRINILRKHSRNPFPGDLLLEAEGCDNYGGANGGNGKANFYRNGNIAIETTNDSPGGGYDVGWIQNGEWLEWKEVPLNGTPHFMVRVATTTATARVHWVIDGVALPSVTLPNTGGWQTWTTFDTGPQGTFTKSYHTVRIVFENGGESINWWQLSTP